MKHKEALDIIKLAAQEYPLHHPDIMNSENDKCVSMRNAFINGYKAAQQALSKEDDMVSKEDARLYTQQEVEGFIYFINEPLNMWWFNINNGKWCHDDDEDNKNPKTTYELFQIYLSQKQSK